jgi:hypothetical protein
MTRLARILVTLMALLLPAMANASGKDEGWVVAAKARSPQDISLWTRVVPGAELKAFRGATHTEADIASTVAMLNDEPTICQWTFRCEEVRKVGTADNGDIYFYLKIKGLWPVSDRDAVIRAHPMLNTRTGELVITGVAEPDYLPRSPSHVRIPSIESTWRLTPAGNNLLRVEWEGHVDPAGSVPRWMSNAIATLIPRYTLNKIRNLLTEPQWRSPAVRDAGQALLGQVRHRVQ